MFINVHSFKGHNTRQATRHGGHTGYSTLAGHGLNTY